MKQSFSLFFLFLITLVSLQAQNSFEGMIQFSIEVYASEAAPDDTEQLLKDIYGNRAELYFASNGDFRLQYKHSRGTRVDADADYFFVGKDYLYSTNTLNRKVDSTNITKEPAQLLAFTQLNNERILGKDCECYEYKAIDNYKEPAIFTYCFSPESPTINPEHYTNYKHFFLGDFFKIAQRPYVKFSYQIEDYRVTFTATKLIEKEVNRALFRIE